MRTTLRLRSGKPPASDSLREAVSEKLLARRVFRDGGFPDSAVRRHDEPNLHPAPEPRVIAQLPLETVMHLVVMERELVPHHVRRHPPLDFDRVHTQVGRPRRCRLSRGRRRLRHGLGLSIRNGSCDRCHHHRRRRDRRRWRPLPAAPTAKSHTPKQPNTPQPTRCGEAASPSSHPRDARSASSRHRDATRIRARMLSLCAQARPQPTPEPYSCTAQRCRRGRRGGMGESRPRESAAAGRLENEGVISRPRCRRLPARGTSIDEPPATMQPV